MAGFASTILIVLAQTLNHSEPHWKLDLSLAGTNITLNSSQIGTNSLMNCSHIGTNPGISEPEPESIVRLEYAPTPDNHNDENNLIRFHHGVSDKASWKQWVDRLQATLEPYQQFGETIMQCDYSNPSGHGKVCVFDLRMLGMNCSRERNFGYDYGQPCVLLKMNRVFDWVPEAFDRTNLPADMPEDLREYIRRQGVDHPLVGLTCEGESPADRKNMGPIVYAPRPGFPTYYYPDKNIPHFMAPFVMVQFLKPKLGVLVRIECKAWAKNIAHDRMERRGSVRFEMLIE